MELCLKYKNMAQECGLDSTDTGQNPAAGSCELGNEPSWSIQGGGFLNQLGDY